MSRRFAGVPFRCAAVFAAVWSAGVAHAAAAETLKDTTSLQFIPANVGYYSTSLRLKEQFSSFVNSNAFRRFKRLPFVRKAMTDVRALLDDPRIARVLSQPENQQLLDLLKDMVSREVFVFGEEPFQIKPGVLATEDRRVKFWLACSYWNSVVGFRLSDTDRAFNQLERLESAIHRLLAGRPNAEGAIRKITIRGSKYLQVEFKGSMIPWEKVRIALFGRDPNVFDAAIPLLNRLKVAVTVGVRGKYLLLAVGDAKKTDALLKGLGTGPLLYDRAEFAPLRKAVGKRMTSISYVSRKIARSGGLNGQLDNLIDIAVAHFDRHALVGDKLKKEFRAAAEALKEAIKGPSADAGPVMSYTFRTDRGYESFRYDWARDRRLDFSKRLTLLDHVGGSPILFVVGRSQGHAETYERLVAFAKKVFSYGDAAAVSRMNSEQRTAYRKFRKAVLPFVAGLHAANSRYLIPALKDGQAGFVLDARIASKRWFPPSQATESPLPMAELGFVFGVSDAETLKQGCREYLAAARKAFDVVHKAFPSIVPAGKLPRATVTRIAGETVYSYPQLTRFGFDPQIAPSAGLSKRVAVLATSPKLAGRVLRRTPLSLEPGLLTDRNRPLAGATCWNWPALVDAVTPWVEYRLRHDSASRPKAGDRAGHDVETNIDQVRSVAEILKCFRGMTTATYREGNVIITHSESVWKDFENSTR